MRVIGIGDNVVDRYTNKRIMFPGGNAVNFAAYAAQCGADSAYLGVIADDKEGRLVRDSLIETGVDVSKSPLKTGLATERCDVILKDGDRVFTGCSYGEGEYRTLTLSEENLRYLERFDVIHCGCYASMEDEEEYRTEDYLEKVCPYIDIALFSAEEMTEQQTEKLRKQVTRLGTKLVLITNGTKGQKLWDGSREYSGKVKLVEPVDTMGAGDSFFTAFVISMVKSGYDREKAVTVEMTDRAFSEAADFSARTCLVEGAFGFGTSY